MITQVEVKDAVVRARSAPASGSEPARELLASDLDASVLFHPMTGFLDYEARGSITVADTPRASLTVLGALDLSAPRVTFEISTDSLDVDALRAFAASPGGAPPTIRFDDLVQADVDHDLLFVATNLRLGGVSVPRARIEATGSRRALEVRAPELALLGGKVTGTAKADLEATPPVYSLGIDATGLRIDDIAAAFDNPGLAKAASGRVSGELAESKYHFWVQDDWKVTNTLTLNAGLRWEPWLPPTDSLNNLVGFVEGQRSTMAPDAPLGMVYPGDTDIPKTLFSKDWGAWAPRVGFAWDLRGTGRTVLRAGYGIFYIDPALTIYTRTVSTQPSVLTVNIVNPFSFQDPYRGAPGGNPYPFPRVQPEGFYTFRYVRPVSGGVLDPAAEKGYSQNWNIIFEQQIWWDVALSLAYVDNKGTDIMGAKQLNPAVYSAGATTGNTQARRIYSARPEDVPT